MLKAEIIRFLEGIPLLDGISTAEMQTAIEDVSQDYYPRGTVILAQDGPPAQFLHFIRRGGVKVTIASEEEEEIVIDYRSEGEHFGLLSLVSGDRSRTNVTAVEETICLLLTRERVLDLIQGNSSVNEYVLKSFFVHFIDKTHQEMRKKYIGLSPVDRLLFTTPVGEIITRDPVTAPEDISIRKAARIMAEHRVGSLVMVSAENVPIGIVTDRDLRDKVVARGRDIEGPVAAIMSTPLIKVAAEEQCFEALLTMMRYNIHHILVVEEGHFKGIVTNHDFMVLQGSSPTMLAKEMESFQSLEDLSHTAPKLTKAVSTLLREGAKAHNVTGLVSELVEKLLCRILELVERQIGAPPVPYTVFWLGDGARREISLEFPVQVGIVYEDTKNLTLIRAAEAYFAELAKRLNQSISMCLTIGDSPCLAGEDVCSFSDWRELFDRWGNPEGDHPPRGDFFDMRVLRGEELMVRNLREHLMQMVSSRDSVIMDRLAALAVRNRPPLGFFKRFVVEKSGEHRNELNLAEKGIRPLVEAVRLFALEKGLSNVSTVRRLHELKVRHEFEPAADTEQALDYLLALLLHHQLRRIEEGGAADSFLDPEGLATLERKTLKEIFQLAANLYDLLEKRFRIVQVGA